MAFVVYFFIVKPYEKAKDRYFPAEPDAETIDPNTELLREIRDELRAPRPDSRPKGRSRHSSCPALRCPRPVA